MTCFVRQNAVLSKAGKVANCKDFFAKAFWQQILYILGEFEKIMWDAILEALLDSLKALPILLVVYVLIEFMEHKGGVKFEKKVASSKKLGPLWGAGLGIVPQCGFSAIMSDLYSRKMITIGTLFAVFVATSDEAIPLLISNPKYIGSLAILLLVKLVLAIAIGYLFDLIFRKTALKQDNLEHNAHFEHEHSHKHSDNQKNAKAVLANCQICETEIKSCDVCAHDHLHHHHEIEDQKSESKSKIFWNIVLQGVLHTLQIFAWILIANILISVALQLAGGEGVLQKIVGTNAWYQPLVTALIGLLPNCAGSVALVELYMQGMISFSACLGGLCAGAGVGLIILFKNNKKTKDNIFIVLALYLIGVIVGYLFGLFLPSTIVF